MRRLYVLLFLLLFIALAFFNLLKINTKALELPYVDHLKPLIIAKNSSICVEKDNPYFDPLDNFKILSRSSYSLSFKSQFDIHECGEFDYLLKVDNEGNFNTSSLKIKVKEKETKTLIKEKIIYKESTRPINENTIPNNKTSDSSKISLPFKSNASDLLKIIPNYIKIDSYTTIDYGAVNFSKKGTYPLKVYKGDKSYDFLVELY